jgi:hypothetical protein
VCHAVRAPGVKWTLFACRRDGSVGRIVPRLGVDPARDYSTRY